MSDRLRPLRRARWLPGGTCVGLLVFLFQASAQAQPNDIIIRGYLALAGERQAQGDPPGMEAALKEVLRRAPAHLEALIALGTLKRKTGARQQAIDYFSRVLEIDPEDGRVAAEIWQTYEEARDLRGALGELGALAEEYPENPYVVFYHARALFENKRHREAESRFLDVLGIAPDIVPAHSMLRKIVYEQRERAPERAREIYLELVRAHPRVAQVHVGMGFVCQEKEPPDYDCAIKHHGIAAEFQEDEPQYHINLGRVLLEAERFEEALDAYRRADHTARSTEDKLIAQFGIGRALSGLRQFREALPHLSEAERLNYRVNSREQPAILHHLGRAYFEAGHDEAAQAYFQRFEYLVGGGAINSPAFFDMYIQMGKAHVRMGAWEASKTSFSRAENSVREEKGPRLAVALYYMGESLLREGDLETSREKLQESVRLLELATDQEVDDLDPEETEDFETASFMAYLRLAEVSGQLDRVADALDALARVEPRADSPARRAQLARTQGLVVLSSGGEQRSSSTDRAVELFDQALELAPEDAGILGDKATALAEAGQYADARGLLNQLRELPGRERPELSAADLLIRLARVDLAEAKAFVRKNASRAGRAAESAESWLDRVTETVTTLSLRREINNILSFQQQFVLEQKVKSQRLTMILVIITLGGLVFLRWFQVRVRNVTIKEAITQLESGIRGFIKQTLRINDKQPQSDVARLIQSSDHKRAEKLVSTLRGRSAHWLRPRPLLDSAGLGDMIGLMFDIFEPVFERKFRGIDTPQGLRDKLVYINAIRIAVLHMDKSLDPYDVDHFWKTIDVLRPVFVNQVPPSPPVST